MHKMEHRLIRTLTCFSNTDERLVFDVQLQDFNLQDFQKEFKESSDNPMYDSYEISVKNLPFLKTYLPKSICINWDFNKYAYFIECVEN